MAQNFEHFNVPIVFNVVSFNGLSANGTHKAKALGFHFIANKFS